MTARPVNLPFFRLTPPHAQQFSIKVSTLPVKCQLVHENDYQPQQGRRSFVALLHCNNATILIQRFAGLCHEFQSYLNEIAAYLHEIGLYLMEIDIAFLGDRTVSRGIAYKEN